MPEASGIQRPGLIARALLWVLRGYKRWLSPLLPRSCRFEPTCSDYARLAIVKYGALRGVFKAAGRILRCHPFHPGGVDYP
ncbi:MAG: membrane protein insertion efficiency factor YidD [Planctomycetota bacterium]